MWYITSKNFAQKVLNASGQADEDSASLPSCPTCGQAIPEDKLQLQQSWEGVPLGVKFDPTDWQVLDHLAAKKGLPGTKLHPMLDEFILTLDVCNTHPENIPGVTRDGCNRYFFHLPVSAYAKGSRKRRKVEDEDNDTRWHKTGKTKALCTKWGGLTGWKKIMVLYTDFKKGQKGVKTHWVMHQYHIGRTEDEGEELVISKIFWQKEEGRRCKKNDVEEEQEASPSTPDVTNGVRKAPEVVRPEARRILERPPEIATTSLIVHEPTPDQNTVPVQELACEEDFLDMDLLDTCHSDIHKAATDIWGIESGDLESLFAGFPENWSQEMKDMDTFLGEIEAQNRNGNQWNQES